MQIVDNSTSQKRWHAELVKQRHRSTLVDYDVVDDVLRDRPFASAFGAWLMGRPLPERHERLDLSLVELAERWSLDWYRAERDEANFAELAGGLDALRGFLEDEPLEGIDLRALSILVGVEVRVDAVDGDVRVRILHNRYHEVVDDDDWSVLFGDEFTEGMRVATRRRIHEQDHGIPYPSWDD